MTGIVTGVLMILIGGLAFGLARWVSRKSGSPLAMPNTIGGYNGVVGLGIMACGVIVIVASVVNSLVG